MVPAAITRWSKPMSEHAAFPALASRIRAEYQEMPGMRLTLSQAAKLWHIDMHACEAILAALVDAGFLRRTRDGAFLLNSSGSRRGPRSR